MTTFQRVFKGPFFFFIVNIILLALPYVISLSMACQSKGYVLAHQLPYLGNVKPCNYTDWEWEDKRIEANVEYTFAQARK